VNKIVGAFYSSMRALDTVKLNFLLLLTISKMSQPEKENDNQYYLNDVLYAKD
jgi:hypothetical protein